MIEMKGRHMLGGFRFLALACITMVGISQLDAATGFGSLDLSPDGTLLFGAVSDSPGYGAYKTGFMADLKGSTITQLSFFPESAQYLPKSREIHIENRFGMFRIPFPFTQPRVMSRFPSFTSGAEIREGRSVLSSPSPDGTWLVYQRTTSPAFAELVLLELATGQERILSARTEYSVQGPPVAWNPESDLLVYENGNELFYFSITQYRTGRVLDESFRKLGEGRINSLVWGQNRQLYYIKGSIVYEILTAELFTRSLYLDFLNIGRIIGRLPHTFDPDFDHFSLSPDGRILLLAKNSHTYYLYPMNEEAHPDGLAWRLPFLSVPRAASFVQALWSSDGMLSLLFESANRAGELRSIVYRLDTAQTEPNFVLVESPRLKSITQMGDKLIALAENSIKVLEGRTWKEITSISHPEPLYVFPLDGSSFVVLGAWYAEQITLTTAAPRSELLFFTQSETIGFDRESGLVSQSSKGRGASLSQGRWLTRTPLALRPAQTANSQVRVYPEVLHSGPYRNIIMLRKVQEVGTYPLFPGSQTVYDAFPTQDDPLDPVFVRYGSRIRTRAVALTFNAVDSVEGLEMVLQSLRGFGVKATFFINGEFLRKYPAAVAKIASEGHEMANLFYTWFNFTNQKYRIDTDFIKLGLARNEDEYREVTGRELTLLWRSPYGLVNRQVLDASKDLRYTLIGSDVDALEYETRRNLNGTLVFSNAAQIVEQILTDKKPGSIINLGIGKSVEYSGLPERNGYSFQKLDVLVQSLIQRGYELVTVSRLIEASR